LENFFGFVRWGANRINTANEMIGTIAHTDIAQEADRDLKLEEHAHHRVNLAGVHIDENPPHAKTFHIEMPTNLDPETIAGISIKVVHIQNGILSDDELVAFLQFRDYLTLIATTAAAGRTSKEIKHGLRVVLDLALSVRYTYIMPPPRTDRITKPILIHPPGISPQHPMVKPIKPVRETHKCPEPD
jgi:hypothetical protein